MTPHDLLARHCAAAELLASVHDVLHERPTTAAPPSWAVARGWDAWLSALSDDVVTAWEERGVAGVPADAPTSLASLAAAVREVTTLPSVADMADGRLSRSFPPRRASPRKQAQVAAFAAAARALAVGRGRIVDAGSGHGHLTRALAGAFALPAVGLERDDARVQVANALTIDPRIRFESVDVLAPGFTLERTDLAVGLHACGELGDVLVTRASDSGASLALVGCCPQKRRGDARAPFVVPRGMDADELTLARDVLGAGNLAARADGVEGPLADTIAARERRFVVHALLHARGVHEPPGEVMRGLNRRRAHDDDDTFARAACLLRDQPAPTAAELAAARVAGARTFAAVRRQALPRNLLARLVEVFVLLDRAALLVKRDRSVDVGVLFREDISPRNLVLLAG